MGLYPESLQKLQALLKHSEIIPPDSVSYMRNSRVWSLHSFKNPAIVLKPSSLESLQRVLPYLYEQDFDFAIHGQGFGGASSADVVLNISAFDEVTFDSSSETVVVGAGQTWGDLYRKLDGIAPGYAVVGIRTPPISIGGGLLYNGISWLSHEHGLGNDPQNLLDVQIVLKDGRTIWASSEPKLLWALRGGGGNFGVVTAVKLKAYMWNHKCYTGFINIPASGLEIASRGLSDFAKTCIDPKVACNACIFHPGQVFFDAGASIGIMPFDAHGKEHGEKTFSWALNIPGAQIQTMEVSLLGLHELQAFADQKMMAVNSWQAGALVKDLDPEFLVRAWKWHFDTLRDYPALVVGTYTLIEVLQPKVFSSIESRAEAAWPRPMGQRHILQFGTGFQEGEDATPEIALKALKEGVAKIYPGHDEAEFLPAWIEPSLTSVEKVYAENYEKLREIKQEYDPKDKFCHGVSFPGNDA